MNYLIILLLALLMTSCASEGLSSRPTNCEMHALEGVTKKIPDTGFYYCARMIDGKAMIGVRSESHQRNYDWVIKPQYEYLTGLNNRIFFVQKYGVNNFSHYDLETEALKETNYIYLRELSAYGVPKKLYNEYTHHFGLLGFNGSTAYILDKITGEEVKKILNVDETVKISGEYILPYYTGGKGGILIRHKEGNNKYYVVYSDKGEALTNKIPVTDLTIRYTSNDQILFLQKTSDPELYWPLLFDGNSVFLKPEKTLGIYTKNLRINKKLLNERSSLKELSSQFYIKVKSSAGDSVIKNSTYSFLKEFNTSESVLVNSNYINDSDNSDLIILPSSEKISYSELRVMDEIIGPELLFKSKKGNHYYLTNPHMSFKTKEEAFHYVETRKAGLAEQKILFKKRFFEDRDKYREMSKVLEAKDKEMKRHAQADFIRRIETSGPNNSSVLSFDRDVEMYCAYGGRRCEELRRQARNNINNHNNRVEQQNSDRLDNLYNGETQYERDKKIKREECRRRANTLNEHAGKRSYTCD